jgi:hypothetical protein
MAATTTTTTTTATASTIPFSIYLRAYPEEVLQF